MIFVLVSIKQCKKTILGLSYVTCREILDDATKTGALETHTYKTKDS